MRFLTAGDGGKIAASTFSIVDTRMAPVDLITPKRSTNRTKEHEDITVTVETTDQAWACRSPLPEELDWEDIKARSTYQSRSGDLIEHLEDVPSLLLDDLPRPLAEFGVALFKFRIEFKQNIRF